MRLEEATRGFETESDTKSTTDMVVNVLFYGIMVMQSFIYFQRFKQ